MPIANPLGAPLSEKELCPADLLPEQEAAFARDIARLHARSAEHVPANCPACGADRPLKAFDKQGFSFQTCQSCRTLYMSPRPSERLMGDYYANSENYAYWAKHIFPSSEAARREKIHKPWLNRVLGYCESFGIPRRVLLEAGPGFGTFASLATESGQFERVIGVEPTPQMAEACRSRGVEILEKRIEDIGDEIPLADIVCAFEVIEHLFEPRRFLEGVRRIMAAGSLLILSCPNSAGFDVAMLGEKSSAVDVEHVNLFTPESLSLLVESAGFDIMIVHTPGRLDAELVREVALQGGIALDPIMRRILIDEWDRLGWPFQQFLAENNLSSHMWLAARRRQD